MHSYTIHYQYSRDGKLWISGSSTVRASCEAEGIAQIQSKYPYVRNIKITLVR